MPLRLCFIFALIVLCVSACASSLGDRVEKSDHFDGERFHNHSPDYKDKSFGDLLKWVFNREKVGSWTYQPLADSLTPPPARVNEGIQLTFVNHATLLIQVDGLNILTDPIWSKRCSPIPFAGPARYHPPGVPFESLPPIDLVLLSHNHYDHFDRPTLKRLNKDHSPLFVAGLGNESLLSKSGIPSDKILGLDWWQAHRVNDKVVLHGTPAQHWSTRNRIDTNKSLWMSYVLETSEGPVYFAGDTGLGKHFSQISDRYGPMRLSLLPIGAYTPRWFMKDNHLSPADALLAHDALRSTHSIAMHFGTFALGDDGQTIAADELRKLRAQRGMPETAFRIPTPGGRYDY
ncbi:MAG: MBL fold metallo-hydrolase [Pseudomonadales bacterium]